MKNLALLILSLAIGISSCAPGKTAVTEVASQTAPPTPLATPAQTSSAPLSESLLLVRYISSKQVNVLTAIDPANGYELAGVTPIPLGQNYYYKLSPDRKTLAVVIYQSGDYPHDAHLYLIDLENWSLRDDIDLALNEWVFNMDYAPDGRQLALATSAASSTILVVDTLQGKILVQGKKDFAIRKMKFSAQGASLMLYGVPQDSSGVTTGNPVAMLVGAGDLNTLWSAGLPRLRDGLYRKEGQTGDLHAPGQALQFIPGLAFAPRDDVFYIVDAEKDELVSVDFAARTIRAREVHAELSWFEQLLALTAGTARAKGADGNEKSAIISPDGRFLYVTSIHNESVKKKDGEWEFNQTPLGLQVIRTADAIETGKFETKANAPLVSADGNYVYLDIWGDGKGAPATQIFDTRQGKIIASMSGFLLTPTHRLNGAPVLVSGYTTNNGRTQLAVFEADSTDPIVKWPASDYAAWIIMPE